MKQKKTVYSEERHRQFAADMTAHGYTVEHYRGRCHYEGPCVIVPKDRFQTVILQTTVKDLQSDKVGNDDLVIYP